MPRNSPYRITLNPDEKKRLQKTANSYTSPYYEVVRARIILYASKGLNNKEIASRVDLPRQIVSKWRKRFFEEGLAGLKDQPRPGKPSPFSP